MKFRFQKYKNMESHCRNIVISNDVTINDQSVLYYDCYWSLIDGTSNNGQSHILDFEATDDVVVNRGRYYFNIPSAKMLSKYYILAFSPFSHCVDLRLSNCNTSRIQGFINVILYEQHTLFLRQYGFFI